MLAKRIDGRSKHTKTAQLHMALRDRHGRGFEAPPLGQSLDFAKWLVVLRSIWCLCERYDPPLRCTLLKLVITNPEDDSHNPQSLTAAPSFFSCGLRLMQVMPEEHAKPAVMTSFQLQPASRARPLSLIRTRLKRNMRLLPGSDGFFLFMFARLPA